jgi:hypothetical protein
MKKITGNKPPQPCTGLQTSTDPALASVAAPEPPAVDPSCAVPEAESTYILIQGFADLGHFLAWHHIQVPKEAVFSKPRPAKSKSAPDDKMIVIRGFNSLGHFIDWLDARGDKKK